MPAFNPLTPRSVKNVYNFILTYFDCVYSNIKIIDVDYKPNT